VGQIIKTLLRPVRTMAALTSAAALDAVRPRSELVAENALLRLQILVLARAAPPRPRLFREDRLLLVLLARVNTAWRDALHLVQPDTLLRWHRDLFTLFWRRRSRRTHRSRGLGAEVVELIRTMANANALWGAERIRVELLKLGMRVSKRTIQKYLRACRPRAGRGQTWRTFLRNHAPDIWACDPGCVVDSSRLRATQPLSDGRVGMRRWTGNRVDERSSQHDRSVLDTTPSLP
jgi:hypothetical protein